MAFGLLCIAVIAVGVEIVRTRPTPRSQPWIVQASFRATPVDCGGYCSFGGATVVRPWIGAPRSPLAELDLDRLAADSLAWFRGSPASVEWRDEPTAALSLQYSSEGRAVTIRHVTDAEWREQLGVWLHTFPSDPLRLPKFEVGSYWAFELGSELRIDGFASTPEEAVDALKVLAGLPLPRAASEEATFSPRHALQSGARSIDTAQTSHVDRIADLPGHIARNRALADRFTDRRARRRSN